jgi:hypothetical protein
MRNKPRGRPATPALRAAAPGALASGHRASSESCGTEGSGAATEATGEPAWPRWARVVVSAVLLFHFVALLAGALGVAPSSLLERMIADWFTPYYDLADLGYSYRFYAEPPPTPVVTATLKFGDGQPKQTVRLPGRQVAGPRMRHQRQLALANALFNDVQEVKRLTGDPSHSRLARAYARHLCLSRPDCREVTLHLQQHLIPDPDRVRNAARSPGAARYDLFAEILFTTPEWIGDYPCDGF